jgi:MerR family transcriptional regulator, redox-sensitive transcriptional activator SoxR
VVYFCRMVPLLTIGEGARHSGVAASALRFYEERGLIASERAGSGHRRYPRPVLRRTTSIAFAQRIGLTLDEIGAELAKLPPERVPTRRDWSRLARTWTSRIRARASQERAHRMHRLRLCLDRALEACQSRRSGGRLGAGSRYWVGDRPRVDARTAPHRPRVEAGHNSWGAFRPGSQLIAEVVTGIEGISAPQVLGLRTHTGGPR